MDSCCTLLAETQVIIGILFGFFLFNLLLTTCDFREELLSLRMKMAAYPAYPINIYWAFVLLGTRLEAETKTDGQSTVLALKQHMIQPLWSSGHNVPSTFPNTVHVMTSCFVSRLHPCSHLSHWTASTHLGAYPHPPAISLRTQSQLGIHICSTSWLYTVLRE